MQIKPKRIILAPWQIKALQDGRLSQVRTLIWSNPWTWVATVKRIEKPEEEC